MHSEYPIQHIEINEIVIVFQRSRKKYNLRSWTIVNMELGFYLPPNGTPDSKTRVLQLPWKQVQLNFVTTRTGFLSL
jgi:hypothetical protein